MTKTYSPALAFSLDLKVSSLSPVALLLTRKKQKALQHGVLIPDDYIADVEAYGMRNRIVKGLKANEHGCCPACIKAHAFVLAKKHQLTKAASDYVLRVLPGVRGHKGYYLDQEELVHL